MEEYTDYQLIKALNTWVSMDAPDTFNDDFLVDVSCKAEINKYKLMPGQRKALENIATRFKVDIDSYLPIEKK